MNYHSSRDMAPNSGKNLRVSWSFKVGIPDYPEALIMSCMNDG